MAKTKSCFLSIGKIQESNRHPPAQCVPLTHTASGIEPLTHNASIFPLLPPRLPLMSPRESLSAHNEIPMMSSCKHQCQHLLEFGMSVAGHIVILCHVQNAVIHCAIGDDKPIQLTQHQNDKPMKPRQFYNGHFFDTTIRTRLCN